MTDAERVKRYRANLSPEAYRAYIAAAYARAVKRRQRLKAEKQAAREAAAWSSPQ